MTVGCVEDQMGHSKRARNPECIAGVTDPESTLRSAREELILSVKVLMPGENEHFSVTTEEKRLETDLSAGYK